MKIVDRYIIKELKLPTILSVSIFTFIFLIDIMVSLMENVIVRGISILDTLRILSFYIPPILVQTIPVGFFLGVMITFSNFTKNSESIAMSSMGLSLKKIIEPVLRIGFVGFLGIIFLQEYIVPQSFEKLQYITEKIVSQNPSFQLQSKTFINEIKDFSIYIDEVDKENISKGVLILQENKNSDYPILVFGQKSYFENGSMMLQEAKFYKFKEDGTKDIFGNFGSKKIVLSDYTKEMKLKVKDVEAMGIVATIKAWKLMPREKVLEKRILKIQMNKKIAIPISMLLFAAMGVLLSNGHHRSGKGASFIISFLIIFGYIILLNIGIVFATNGKIKPAIGVWTPDLILLIVTYISYKIKAKVM